MTGIERALGLVEASPRSGYPNPTVGAVVATADGAVAGEGVSEPAGGRHAEIVALAAAGERARGSTLYVTMEPCAQHGRTTPCVDAIVAAGVATVVA
jgi:diaminohydroxyphosphoribosylaminopyrimidine deaminase/5-amino-6-(5-phosphoribosylamino)uracil reductase